MPTTAPAAKKTSRHAPAAQVANAPFFIMGCVRSGTTMLRDMLRLHPNLACPEETHFFRWADPYGTAATNRVLTSNPVLKKHRAIDGISEAEFQQMVASASSRADLYDRYMKLFMARKKPSAKRWFDKTPQNVYGAHLAAATVRQSRFVHIVRNPVNVVASLRIGKVMSIEQLIGAINYWREAVAIMVSLKRANPGRVHELRYEDVMRDPQGEIKRLLDFLGEPYDSSWFASVTVNESDHTEAKVLSDGEIAHVNRLCGAAMRRHGYLPAADGAAATRTS